jgi:hypothetical protein
VAGLGGLPQTAIEKALIDKYGKEKTEKAIGAASTALGIVPGVGTAKSLFEAYTGHDILTGKPLSKLDRGMTVLGLMTIGAVGASSLVEGSEEVALQANRLGLAAEAGPASGAKDLVHEVKADSALFDDVRQILVNRRSTWTAAEKADFFERAAKNLGEAQPAWRTSRKAATNAVGYFTDGRLGYAIDEKGVLWETQDVLAGGHAGKDGAYALDYAKWKRVESNYFQYPTVYAGKEPPVMPRSVLPPGNPYRRLRQILEPGTTVPANDNDTWIWVNADEFRFPRSSEPHFDPRIDPSKVRRW